MTSFAALPETFLKDASPNKTLEKIKNILRQYEIQTEEIWNDSNVPNCWSFRLNVVGTGFGVNGKGLTKEFAMASGYGELMERLQLGTLIKDKPQDSDSTLFDSAQSISVPAKELLEGTRHWYTLFAKALKDCTGEELSEADILARFTDPDGNVSATPYYCVTTEKKAYLPTALRKSVYASNGAAAGNTMEEAVVQAISEIVERRHKLRILAEQIVLPEIPEDQLKESAAAWEIISFLREKGFRVAVKDCSLGTKFPVVCVTMVDLRTGRYHAHFGAHPSFRIALERTLTESFQGRNLQNVCHHEDFCPKDEDLFALHNLTYELRRGTSEKKPEFFLHAAKEPYVPNPGFSGGTNRKLLQEIVDFFREQGLDILVRDCSCLGFPTYQVVIPGYSEVFPNRLSSKHDDLRYDKHVMHALKDPSKARPEDLLGLLLYRTKVREWRLTGLSDFVRDSRIPAKLTKEEDSFLLSTALAHTCYTLGRSAEAAKYAEKALRNAAPKDQEYLICVKRYLSLQAEGKSPKDVRMILEHFHQAKTVETLYGLLDTGKNPFDPVTLHCDSQCTEQCLLGDRCRKKRTDELGLLISKQMPKLDFDAFAKAMQAALH